MALKLNSWNILNKCWKFQESMLLLYIFILNVYKLMKLNILLNFKISFQSKMSWKLCCELQLYPIWKYYRQIGIFYDPKILPFREF